MTETKERPMTKEEMLADDLGSRPDYHSDPVEQLAFELAFELEDAELSPDDYVTVNREKLRLIAKRVLSRRSPSPSAEGMRWALENALNERDLFINPHVMEKWADEIDCCPGCENVWWESDTNASGCHKSENADYCPNDLAETLRAVAKVARAALSAKEQSHDQR